MAPGRRDSRPLTFAVCAAAGLTLPLAAVEATGQPNTGGALDKLLEVAVKWHPGDETEDPSIVQKFRDELDANTWPSEHTHGKVGAFENMILLAGLPEDRDLQQAVDVLVFRTGHIHALGDEIVFESKTETKVKDRSTRLINKFTLSLEALDQDLQRYVDLAQHAAAGIKQMLAYVTKKNREGANTLFQSRWLLHRRDIVLRTKMLPTFLEDAVQKLASVDASTLESKTVLYEVFKATLTRTRELVVCAVTAGMLTLGLKPRTLQSLGTQLVDVVLVKEQSIVGIENVLNLKLWWKLMGKLAYDNEVPQQDLTYDDEVLRQVVDPSVILPRHEQAAAVALGFYEDFVKPSADLSTDITSLCSHAKLILEMVRVDSAKAFFNIAWAWRRSTLHGVDDIKVLMEKFADAASKDKFIPTGVSTQLVGSIEQVDNRETASEFEKLAGAVIPDQQGRVLRVVQVAEGFSRNIVKGGFMPSGLLTEVESYVTSLVQVAAWLQEDQKSEVTNDKVATIFSDYQGRLTTVTEELQILIETTKTELSAQPAELSDKIGQLSVDIKTLLLDRSSTAGLINLPQEIHDLPATTMGLSGEIKGLSKKIDDLPGKIKGPSAAALDEANGKVFFWKVVAGIECLALLAVAGMAFWRAKKESMQEAQPAESEIEMADWADRRSVVGGSVEA